MLTGVLCLQHQQLQYKSNIEIVFRSGIIIFY